MTRIRIFILDDHQIMLDGIKSLLEGDEAFHITGEATRAEDALKNISSCNPDIVISDISLPGMNGIEFTKKLKQEHPHIKVMILTVSAGDHNINELLKTGVSGYVLKNAGREELRKALIKIARGEKYFCSEVAEGLMRMKDGVKGTGDLHLTPRELEVLNLIAREYSNKKIADELVISERTVESHRKNIFRKTGAKSVVGLVRFAMENGYLTT
jgi:two-component system nitrate/nitrite response regulator NarL